jgi:photosystem II stability/assembly factor-like uncharacterized protein
MPRTLLTALLLFGLAAPVAARPDDAKDKETPPEFKGLKYRSIGPAIGGRVCRVAGVPGDPLVYYAATATGGVWKSTDAGLTWKPVFDDQPTSTAGSVAVAPSDPNVVYVGSGEANIRGNVQTGNGVYKSTDAGKTWKRVWTTTGQIGTMIVHPKDPDVAFAAVLGNPFGPNADRGVYRTTDGGKTWQQVLKKDADTGASDVCFDPNNPRILFAGMWECRRRPWAMTSGGPGSGLYVSRDGGDSWDQLGPKTTGTKPAENGLPAGPWGKIGVAVAPSDSRRVYALIEAEKGGLYRSDDGGEKWTLASPHRSIRQRAWYYSTLTVDPVNADVVYFPQVPLLRTIDGGKTIARLPGTHHGDHHDVWIDPKNPRRMICANDGGVDISTNAGESWFAPPLPICQFYHIDCSNEVPYRVAGTIQDIGTASGPSNSLTGGGIPLGDWHTVGGGEAGWTVFDPADPNIVYAGEYGGYISRYDHRTRQSRHIGVYPYNPSGHGAADLRYRFQWTAPIAVSPHDPKVVYHGGNVLFRTKDTGRSWEKVSPDLTRNDRNKQQWSGGPITGDNTGVEVYDTIFVVAESPKQKGLIWVGTDDGLVQVTKDDGKTWTNVTANLPDVPDWGTVACVEPSRFDAGTAYAVVDAHRLADNRPYLYKTTDFGQTWKSLTEGLDRETYLHVVREDPAKKGQLYLGTERGVVFSADDGATWKSLRLNLPPAAVHDIVVKGDDLVLGTLGRSVWVLGGLTPVRQVSKEVLAKPAHLYPAGTAIRWRRAGGETSNYGARYAGENPPDGAVLAYWLKAKAKKPVTLEVLDSKGERVVLLGDKEDSKEEDETLPDGAPPERKKVKLPNEKGLNRFVWDMQYPGAQVIPGAKVDAGDPSVGPLVPPGVYTLKLTADDQTLTTTLTVAPDPRLRTSAEALAARQNGAEAAADVALLLRLEQVRGPAAKEIVGAEAEAIKKLLERVPPLKFTLAESTAGIADQTKLALQLRDDVTKLSETVKQMRAVKKQLAQHAELFKGDPKTADLVKKGKELTGKLDALEAKLHNPKAQVAYDILAQKGGARLYSQLVSLFGFVTDSDGPPTQGMKELAVELESELGKLTGEWESLRKGDVAAYNESAKKQGLPTVYVPPATREDEKKEPAKTRAGG